MNGPKCGCDSRKVEDAVRESRVLCIYTGGTVGMQKNKYGGKCKAYAPVPSALENYIRKIPYMHDEEYVKTANLSNTKFLVMPEVVERTRIMYEIVEYSPLLDSCEMVMENWCTIAKHIKDSYEKYDGFVVFHGTDTLTYTASALSFMFENLGKTVVLTGSQIPAFESRSDGLQNIQNSIFLAGTYNIPEVIIVFHGRVMRGNRTTKVNTEALFPFVSPNMSPLATLSIKTEVHYRDIFYSKTLNKFNVHLDLNPNVCLLRLFPNITREVFQSFLRPPVQGVVMQTYGTGNFPVSRKDLMEEIHAATKRGVIIVNCTQCLTGRITASYETGRLLGEVGVTPGSDMTPEAALTKLAYVISKSEWDMKTKCEMMQESIRGELTPEPETEPEQLQKLEELIASLGITSASHQHLMQELTMSSAFHGCLKDLDDLKRMGADFSAVNQDLRSPLHLASAEGNLKVVRYLLQNGASVHLKDRYGHTPLIDAIHNDRQDVIDILIKTGAHLNTANPKKIGEQLCSAAAEGNLQRLTSFCSAKAYMSQPDYLGNTCLHAASAQGNASVVDELLKMGADPKVKNLAGDTAADLAEKMGHEEIVKLLKTVA